MDIYIESRQSLILDVVLHTSTPTIVHTGLCLNSANIMPLRLCKPFYAQLLKFPLFDDLCVHENAQFRLIETSIPNQYKLSINGSSLFTFAGIMHECFTYLSELPAVFLFICQHEHSWIRPCHDDTQCIHLKKRIKKYIRPIFEATIQSAKLKI
jgi:hypothetical protein